MSLVVSSMLRHRSSKILKQERRRELTFLYAPSLNKTSQSNTHKAFQRLSNPNRTQFQSKKNKFLLFRPKKKQLYKLIDLD